MTWTSDPKTMVSRLYTLAWIALILLTPLRVWGQAHQPVSCLPEVTSLQSFEVWNSESGGMSSMKTYPLKTQRSGQLHATDVLVEVNADSEKQALHLKFKFQDPNVMSLPFNIYSVMVITEGGQTLWKDFTKGCTDPGIGFFPGQEVKLEPILLNIKNHESYRVMIWGQK